MRADVAVRIGAFVVHLLVPVRRGNVVHAGLPCAHLHPLSCARRLARTAMPLAAHQLAPRMHRCAPRGAFAVCMHTATWLNSPLPCVYTRQSFTVFSVFLFFFNFLHFKIENIHICIYITSNTSNTCIYGCIYPQIHQTYQRHAYMHAYNMKYIKHTTNRSKYSYRVHLTS
jgi:hypothetical protein